ncbi:unnamed protein product [Linum trigynum]|uniref:Secreted protein n=1 Tax=Linum trigynum TaxID=586398 RepID=A0AAV2G8H6_9ROSI
MAAWLFATVLAAVAAVWKIWQLFQQVVWRPYVVTKRLRREGVRCRPHSFVSGSMEEVKRLQSMKCADFRLSFWARDFKISRDMRILRFGN